MRTPAVVVNFKAYREVDGPGALELARVCETVAEESGVCIAVCPPMVELSFVACGVGIPVFSQNVDPYDQGSATGWVTPSMAAASGAIGTLINHSEHRSDDERISGCIDLCRGNELLSMVCAESVRKAADVALFSPDFIAIEPPELIGGDVSVTKANPNIIEDAVRLVKDVDKNIALFCGAGIKTGQDVKKALELGADGVLLASGVVRAKDPKAVLLDLIEPL
ncbi:MAG: triose-phosphate isomerase [Candidatus Methanomethylophilaceae archaeon]